MSDESTLGGLLRSEKLLLVVVLLAGVVLPGLLRRWLALEGHDALGTVVFAVGYATMVGVVWWGWLRPLDIGAERETARYDENDQG